MISLGESGGIFLGFDYFAQILQHPAVRAGVYGKGLAEIGAGSGFGVVNVDSSRQLLRLAAVDQVLRHHDHVRRGVAVDGIFALGVKGCAGIQIACVRQRQLARSGGGIGGAAAPAEAVGGTPLCVVRTGSQRHMTPADGQGAAIAKFVAIAAATNAGSAVITTTVTAACCGHRSAADGDIAAVAGVIITSRSANTSRCRI